MIGERICKTSDAFKHTKKNGDVADVFVESNNEWRAWFKFKVCVKFNVKRKQIIGDGPFVSVVEGDTRDTNQSIHTQTKIIEKVPPFSRHPPSQLPPLSFSLLHCVLIMFVFVFFLFFCCRCLSTHNRNNTQKNVRSTREFAFVLFYDETKLQ